MKRLVVLAAFAGLVAAAAAAPAADPVAAGRALYEQGRLPDGAPLVAERLGTQVRGAAAACVQCHRRSGLGVVEGDQPIAPITGRALFGGPGAVVTAMDPVRGKALNQSHEPYTEAEVAAAVREGRHPGGRAMNELMPRYALDDDALAALLAYLRTLSAEWSPGVDAQAIRLATVVAPGVGAARRQAFLDTLQAAVSQKNGSTLPGKRHMVMAAEFTLKTERRWDLAVWELQGEPATWAAQLDAFQRAAPVFALLSGLGADDWAPVQDFCERAAVPCWFPSVKAAPAGAARSQWSLYFSAGAVLEAQVLADRLAALEPPPRRVLQLQGEGAAAAAAAQELAASLRSRGIALETVPAARAARALRNAGPVVGWLAPEELQALAAQAPPRGPLYLSASLGGAERMALPPAWKAAARLVYPYQLPSRRGPNLATFKTWLAQRGVPLVDELMQSEVYFAVGFLRDTLGDMLNNLHRDYLVERAESMLSLRESRKAHEETLERQTIRQRYLHVIETSARAVSAADSLGRRTGTTAYPALGLGPGQRLASKGAYIARFADPDSPELVAESPWLVP